MTTIQLNGTTREVDAGTTVEDLVRALDVSPEGRGVAVAVAAEVVPRGQ